MRTTDLWDAHPGALRLVEPVFRDFGGVRAFHGPVSTLRVHEDNALVRSTLETRGLGRVLVIDGGGSVRSALVGGNLAKLAVESGWSGIVVNGAVRDSVELRQCAVGIKALALIPAKSKKDGVGERDVPVAFAGCTFALGDFVYADEDGIVVASSLLGAD